MAKSKPRGSTDHPTKNCDAMRISAIGTILCGKPLDRSIISSNVVLDVFLGNVNWITINYKFNKTPGPKKVHN